MGYTYPETRYRLVWEVEPFAGLEVVAAEPTVEGYLLIGELAEDKTQVMDKAPLSKEGRTQRLALYEAFAEVLVSWNVETRTGEPVPATIDGLLSQPAPLVSAIVDEWLTRAGTVAPPLSSSESTDGPLALPPEALMLSSLDMEALESLEN